MRTYASFSSVGTDFRNHLNNWFSSYKTSCFLDSNTQTGQAYPGGIDFDFLVAVGETDALSTSDKNAFERLSHFQQEKKDWLFGYLSYDLKNELEKLSSNNPDQIGWAEMQFFQPETVIYQKNQEIVIGCIHRHPKEVFNEILESKPPKKIEKQPIEPQPVISHASYIRSVLGLKHHIQIGDIYEVNFCQEFLAKAHIDCPFELWLELIALSPTPFSAFYQRNEHSLLCASPERYLKKVGSQLISQPIKGTAKRGKTQEEDLAIIEALKASEKEKSENVMIVDLVRNDLSRVAEKASVEVTELCGIYSFPQVHQQISTITAKMKNGFLPVKALTATFPMGSMTGAPKVKAMELIEEFESSKRSVYSGAVGYFTPNGDFDFNVVIRSMLYNQENKNLSFSVGGAITSLCNPEEEYQESLLKAKAIRELLARWHVS